MNYLVGREFRVGGATLRAVELREPCQHIVDVTGMLSLLPTLIHRGSLHAQVLGEGLIRPGDVIEVADQG